MQNTHTRKDIDMTEGVIWKQLLLFAFPLMIGNLFQQFYNTVDSIVVGNFVGKDALAAVGSVGPIINSLIGFFSGLSTGAGVVISQSYGARNEHKVSCAVHTTLYMTFVLCIVATIIGVTLTPSMLHLMDTPADVFDQAAQYLRIYFSGICGLMVYNMGAGILRAVGDSKHPLYFLIFSACTNTVLDILFVAVFRWGIAGVAWATVIAQVLSAILVLILLSRTEGPYQFKPALLKMDYDILQEVIRLGLPAGIQQMITAFSNIFVQGYINAFGSSAMAGWSAYSKIDQFAILPMQSVALASTTFVGQNLGAQKLDRIKKGSKTALLLSMAVSLAGIIPILIFAPYLVCLFNSDAAVVEFGTLFLRMMTPFYLACCFNQVYASILRGLGDAKAPMVIMLSSFVVFRQIYLYIMSRAFGTIQVVAMGYPAGWMVCSLLLAVYYRKKMKKMVL